jgi:hypothetical protein
MMPKTKVIPVLISLFSQYVCYSKETKSLKVDIIWNQLRHKQIENIPHLKSKDLGYVYLYFFVKALKNKYLSKTIPEVNMLKRLN